MRRAAHDGYVTLITTVLPVLRTGSESRPGEFASGWRHLTAAVEGTRSGEARTLLANLPDRPTANDLTPLTQLLARIAGVSRM
ncbi:hypothetical protein [Allorhizocola rhizosphaerae]|uniref:hypothetical protein n=1 Tax=Allorhizocola rhizosphaerae TaxID=1872709 RepID=UPI001B8C791B|nr:hypothetical protein [Allorhizocola rhizosphaerae]